MFTSAKFLRTLSFAAFSLVCAAAIFAAGAPAYADDEFLDPAVAFKFSVSEQAGEIDVHYAIADGYYMYRERYAFAVKAGTATLGTPAFPPGHIKFDENFNKNVETYRNEVTIRIPVNQASGAFDIAVTGQGCADKGICYPPQTHVAHISGAAPAVATPVPGLDVAPLAAEAGGAHVAPVTTPASVVTALPGTPPAASPSVPTSTSTAALATSPTAIGTDQDKLYSERYAQDVLNGHSLPVVMAIFFVLGMALSLLPCSLPMIPILSSIVLGEGAQLTRKRGFSLSLSYVLGMAVVYTTFGIVAALLGQSVAAVLQNPWVLGAFAALMVVFALSMFGAYELQLPQAWQNRVNDVSQRRSGGKLAAVFLMGAISALVVGACMTAPLFGVLAFIAKTGNIAFGGAALFAMALGLGVPLLIVGVGAGALLPRAGAWMDGVKRCFGVLLLAVAIWMVSPVLAVTISMVLWALWLLIGALTLNPFAALPSAGSTYVWRLLGRSLGLLMTLLAVILLIGSAAGSHDLLQPLGVFAGGRAVPDSTATQPAGPVFGRVKSSSQLDQALQSGHRPALFDFYADWCTSCKEMEKFTFTDPRVRARMAQLNLLQADVTDNGPDAQALLKRFNLFGPPAIILFDAQGHELMRVVGEQPPEIFLRSLDQAFGPAPAG